MQNKDFGKLIFNMNTEIKDLNIYGFKSNGGLDNRM